MIPTYFQSLDLEQLPETGPPPARRLKDARTARELFALMKNADDKNSKIRAKVQAMFDGTPPYDPAQLARSQQPYRCNLNFGEAESLLDYAMSGYVDLLNSVEDLVYTPTLFGEENEREYYTTVLSSEISRTLRDWPQFYFNYLHLCTEFLAHGLGIAHFEDQFDWRFRACGQSDFYIPRGTMASEDELEIASSRRVYPVHEIWQKIKDPEAATAAGWNVPATRRALARAYGGNSAAETDYEKLEVELKNNDFLEGARSSTLALIHMWVKEFDGTVTHYLLCDEEAVQEFLYEGPGYFGSMQQGFVMFPYGIGTNAHYHGIRGLGYKIFPAVQVSNRLRSQLIDGATLAASVMLQPGSETDFSNMALAQYGAYSVIAPGMTVIERASPNFQNSVMPVLNDMAQQLQNRTGQYTTQSIFNTGRERTRYEVAAHLEQAAKLSVTSLNLFYQPWDRLLREMVRRMIRPNYTKAEPGGDAIAALRDRLRRRGIPEEAFKAIDIIDVRAVRSVGAGSQAARTVALQELRSLSGSFDPVGRHNLLRDSVVATVGVSQSDRYIKRDPGPRIPMDAKIAVLENEQLVEGKQIEVLPEEMHLVHIEKHLEALQQFIEQVNQGVPLEDVVMRMTTLYEHTFAHLEIVQGDMTMQELVAGYRQSLQQAGEIIANGMKRVQKLEREAQMAGEAGMEGEAPPQQQGPDKAAVDLQQKIAEHQLKLQMMSEEFELKQNIKMQEAELNRRLKDADKAAELMRKSQ